MIPLIDARYGPMAHDQRRQYRTHAFHSEARDGQALPDINGILRRVAWKRYRSIIDGQDAYEQIRIIPEHMERSAVTTPGINEPLEEHVRHVKTVLGILEREKLYLSEGKLQFLCHKLKVLGRVVDDEGIRMDPDKVDRILHWMTPVNRDTLQSFLGAVGFLADDIHNVQVPMGILSEITGDTVPFHWEFTHQRTFDEVKHYIEHIWLMMGASAKGVSAVVAQGEDWRSSKVAALYSAKLSAAQQNYEGATFVWLTDHKGLVHLLNQREVSGHQAWWFEKLMPCRVCIATTNRARFKQTASLSPMTTRRRCGPQQCVR